MQCVSFKISKIYKCCLQPCTRHHLHIKYLKNKVRNGKIEKGLYL